MTAIGNYWGSNDPDFAAEVIYDHSDDPSLGTVTYLPIMEMYPIGDANSDGYVNILDIVLIVNIIENF